MGWEDDSGRTAVDTCRRGRRRWRRDWRWWRGRPSPRLAMGDAYADGMVSPLEHGARGFGPVVVPCAELREHGETSLALLRHLRGVELVHLRLALRRGRLRDVYELLQVMHLFR